MCRAEIPDVFAVVEQQPLRKWNRAMIVSTHQDRLQSAKPSFAVRRLPLHAVGGLDNNPDGLRAGDVVLARVDAVGHHEKLERPDGRRATLFQGDEILVACGARYAPDQYESAVPEALGPADLVAAGGIAGIELQRHEDMKAPTQINLLGRLVDDEHQPINLTGFALAAKQNRSQLTTIAVAGTSMNAGKTHTVASIVRGFSRIGARVAALKVTGTGAGGDLWMMRDAGAELVLDFTDVGLATTYQAPLSTLEQGVITLLSEAAAAQCDVVVIEIADGLKQAETAALLKSPVLRRCLSGVVFAAGDAMGAESGVHWLRRANHRVLAVSGQLTRSPLAIREAASAIDVPCLTPKELASGGGAAKLLPSFRLSRDGGIPSWIAA